MKIHNTILLSGLLSGEVFAQMYKKVKLKDVDVLTLYQGKMTNGRRSSPIPQLQVNSKISKHVTFRSRKTNQYVAAIYSYCPYDYWNIADNLLPIFPIHTYQKVTFNFRAIYEENDSPNKGSRGRHFRYDILFR